MTISTTVTDPHEALTEIRSSCGILAILALDGPIPSREAAAGLKHILLQLEAVEAALHAPMRFTELPILTLADVAREPRRQPLRVIEGGAA